MAEQRDVSKMAEQELNKECKMAELELNKECKMA
jgi:hypothetical protein